MEPPVQQDQSCLQNAFFPKNSANHWSGNSTTTKPLIATLERLSGGYEDSIYSRARGDRTCTQLTLLNMSASPTTFLHPSSKSPYSSLDRPLSAAGVPPPPEHQPAIISLLASCGGHGVMEYNAANLQASDWLSDRHRDLPAVFRDSFSHAAWWSTAQRDAIKAAFTLWDTDPEHALRCCKGYTIRTSTRVPPGRQRKEFAQSHLLSYYLRLLRKRQPTDRDAYIIYNVTIAHLPSAQAFRHGPVGLRLYDFDIHYHVDSASTNLSITAGMKNSWTRSDVDVGGDSSWRMLLEGAKLWVFARPEHREDVKVHFHDQKTFSWHRWSKEESAFFHDHRCVMVEQRAGDIVYIPFGWPYIVKHLTDTLTLHGTILNGWSLPKAWNELIQALSARPAPPCCQSRTHVYVAIRDRLAYLPLLCSPYRQCGRRKSGKPRRKKRKRAVVR